jgi:hypothetical protein
MYTMMKTVPGGAMPGVLLRFFLHDLLTLGIINLFLSLVNLSIISSAFLSLFLFSRLHPSLFCVSRSGRGSISLAPQLVSFCVATASRSMRSSCFVRH